MHFHINDQIYFSYKLEYYNLYLCPGRFFPEIWKTILPTHKAGWKGWVGMGTGSTLRTNLQPMTDGNWHRCAHALVPLGVIITSHVSQHSSQD